MIKHIVHVLDIGSREVVPEVYRLQISTIRKHFIHVFYFRCIEIRHIKLRTTSIIKHGTHICYIPGVEMRHVKLCYVWNITEHAIHISHVLCVEVRYVKLCYFCKFMKHVFHIRHFKSVQILQVLKLLYILAISEPIVATRRTCILERLVKHYLGNVSLMVCIPTWSIITSI